MAVIKPVQRDTITPTLMPVTAYNLYMERMKSISDSLRAAANGQEYLPLQFGGLLGQQQALVANEVVTVVDFDVNSN